MIKRRYGEILLRLLKGFPVVTVLSPRQCGKTTFVRQAPPSQRVSEIYPGKTSYSLGEQITALSADKILPQEIARS